MGRVNEVATQRAVTLPIGVLGNRFMLRERIAAGAASEVFAAFDQVEQTVCVVKVAHLGIGEQGTRMLAEEFARLSDLRHPNLLRVRGGGVEKVGDDVPRPYLAMDRMEGGTLADAVEKGPDSDRFHRFCTLAYALGSALAYLHAKGIIHRDITPNNIRCTESGTPILFDFGLSVDGQAISNSTGATGTLGFIAPEALIGQTGTRSDLFSLGATLYDAWTGVPPFGVGKDSISRMWQGPPQPPSALRAGLPEAWDSLMLSLLAAMPEDRPASARHALHAMVAIAPEAATFPEWAITAPFPAGDPLAGHWVGRSAEVKKILTELERLGEGRSPYSLLALAGPSGSGRRSVIKRAIRDLRLGMMLGTSAPLQVEERGGQALLALFPEPAPPPEEATVEAERKKREVAILKLLAQLENQAQAQPLCVLLGETAEDQAILAAVVRTTPSGRLLFIAPVDQPAAREGTLTLSLKPLVADDILELAHLAVGVDPSRILLEEILRVTGGLASAVGIVMGDWIRNLREGHPDRLPAYGKSTDLNAILHASFASLTPRTRLQVLKCLVLPRQETASLPVDEESVVAGWLRYPSFEISSEHHAQVVWAMARQDPDLRAEVAKHQSKIPADDPRRAEALLVLGQMAAAETGFWMAMERAEAQGAWGMAADFGRKAAALAHGKSPRERRLALARILGVLGYYQEALEPLSEDVETIPREQQLMFVERKAWLLRRAGRAVEAEALLTRAVSLPSLTFAEKASLKAQLARVLISLGRYQDATQVVQDVSFAALGSQAFSVGEAVALAWIYRGELAKAEGAIHRLAGIAQSSLDPSYSGRVANVRGLYHQLAGDPQAAALAYREAALLYEALQDPHGSAAIRLNLGCASAEIGDYESALESFDQATRDLGRLAAGTDFALAAFNAAQLFLQLGDLESAQRFGNRLREDAQYLGIPVFGHQADLIVAEVHRKKKRFAPAQAAYQSAIDGLTRLGMEPLAESARLDLAELLAEMGKLEEAQTSLNTVEREMAAKHITDLPRCERFYLAKELICARIQPLTVEAQRALGEQLGSLAQTARAQGRKPSALRLARAAGNVFGRIADEREKGCAELGRQLAEEMKMQTPQQYWSIFEPGPKSLSLSAKGDTPDLSRWMERATSFEHRLKQLLRINKRLNSDLRLSRILETLIDTVIEMTDAERGFLLLRDANDNLAVRIARNIDQTSIDGPDLALSRSIAKKVAETGEPILTVDAAGDHRFSESLSVSDLHLRSVLAVPLLVKGQVMGTVYVDHRLRKGVFRDEDLAAVMDFAEQGAIALENARLMGELRRREQQVQSLNRRLERELSQQEKVLREVTVELRESREAAALRYDYANLVGQSPPMLNLFRLLDRVTDTTLSVVIEGESGTGKELVARAIHFHGPRKDRPFVSENCAAIPETLLESVLFGHMRGSFTGADRDAKGLFAVADGGTLFLDEVGEMSPGMQGKLLRVLQDGEFYRVGGERPQKVNVRVIAATNRDLSRMVEEGKFRKDLFFRLSVLRLSLPSLRDRREDIPLLVTHFLKKQAETGTTSPKTISSAAIARLMAYPWPGNVRELENEILRAAAFSSGTITPDDLSPHVLAGADPREGVGQEPDSLRIKHRVERLEKLLIREALARSAGNQTKASLLLGLSRFGLQKKLQRYRIAL